MRGEKTSRSEFSWVCFVATMLKTYFVCLYMCNQSFLVDVPWTT